MSEDNPEIMPEEMVAPEALRERLTTRRGNKQKSKDEQQKSREYLVALPPVGAEPVRFEMKEGALTVYLPIEGGAATPMMLSERKLH